MRSTMPSRTSTMLSNSFKQTTVFHTLLVGLVIGLTTPVTAADGGATGAVGSVTGQPNILWIVADDLSLEVGCYGYEHVQTPNLDRLAKGGERFTRSFATAPICSSSRSAFITGVYQTTTGTHPHRVVYPQPLIEPYRPITELLRQAGYYVTNCDGSLKRRGKMDYNFEHQASLYDGFDWSDRAAGQPFFAQVHIKEPHRDFVDASPARRNESLKIPAYYPDHPVIRADWANYLASIEVMDRRVGDVLDRLDREGLSDNTLVFFFGDHGRPHYRDKQWLYDGGIQVPLIVRWPGHVDEGTVSDPMVSLIDVAAATVAAAGVTLPAWMQGRDMLARDFTGRERIFAARDRCGSTLDRIRCLRTARYKYIRNFFPDRAYTQLSGYKELQYPGMAVARALKARGELSGPPAVFWADVRPAEELYDLQADPEELNNLAADPTLLPTLVKLRGELEQWMTTTGDRGDQVEPMLQPTIESSEAWFADAMKKRGLAPQPDPDAYLQWWTQQLDR